jgi:hypothetical protein
MGIAGFGLTQHEDKKIANLAQPLFETVGGLPNLNKVSGKKGTKGNDEDFIDVWSIHSYAHYLYNQGTSKVKAGIALCEKAFPLLENWEIVDSSTKDNTFHYFHGFIYSHMVFHYGIWLAEDNKCDKVNE